MTQPVIIIGAGVGGLSAALALACAGRPVLVLEKESAPGGKMRRLAPAGRPMDAGPTVFTMKPVFAELFARAGSSIEAELTLTKLEVLARHSWDIEGSRDARFDLLADVSASTEAIGRFAGAAEAAGFRAFAADAARVFAALDESFMRAPRPSPLGLARNIGLARLPGLIAGQPFRSLWANLGRYFRDPRLRQLFGRYATYCGASPFEGPGTLMLIAHAELMGVWTLDGGMHALAQALERLIVKKGGDIRYGIGVARIEVTQGRASAIVTTDGGRIAADAILFNGDVSALGEGLLGDAASAAAPPTLPAQRSLSAVTWCIDAPTSGFQLSRHNVFFSDDYPAEFKAIFGARRPPDRPTVYVCAQDRDGLAEAADPPPSDRLLCLVNAPAEGDRAPLAASDVTQLGEAAFGLMRRCGLEIGAPEVSVVTTPEGFHRLFPATGGALYGAAGHGPFAPFRRMGSESHVPGLYLAGGSTHPSAGVPMAAISGMLAADAIEARLRAARQAA
ncbi:MAG: 1-hydroxycarotenoid 3,4-desaturase CrtD [Beijerinckiaceae bacterium]